MRIIVWCARQPVLALIPPFLAAAAVLGQTIPRLGSDFEKLWTVESGPSWLEGPAYDGAGSVWFTNLKDGSRSTPTSILRHDIATGTTAVMVEDSGGANGLAFDQEGRLLAALWHDGSLTRRSLNDLTNVTVLADNWQGTPLVAPNDLDAAGDGGIFFTDSRGRVVFYLNPDGDLSLGATLGSTNGIALSPAGENLYVASGSTVFSFKVSGDRTLTDRQVFARAGASRFIDGMTVDRLGNLYAATLSRESGHDVLVWNGAGEPVLAFEAPEPAINLTFAPGDILYLTTLTSLYRVPITFVPEPSGLMMICLAVGTLSVFAFCRRSRGDIHAGRSDCGKHHGACLQRHMCIWQ